MANEGTLPIGAIGWVDLTVSEGDSLRDFYSDVVGWKPEPVAVGDYSDYMMLSPETGTAVAGVCHARGTNAAIPPQWLMYIHVSDVDASASRAEELGGAIVDGPRNMGAGRFCVIKDTAGAICALWNPGVEEHPKD